MKEILLEDDIKELGYDNPIYVDNIGWCGLQRMIFTTGVFYDITSIGYSGRYCFKYYQDAKEALLDIHNIHLNSNWIKHKGHVEYSNPLNRIKMIACINSDNYIGLNNQLLYKISDDLKYFKKCTENHIVVMGYNTFLSLNSKPLPNRLNVVLTKKNIKSTESNLIFTNDFNTIIPLAAYKDIWIIGGEQVYKQFIDVCSEIHLTIVNDNKKGDTKFPDFNKRLCGERIMLDNEKFKIVVYSITNN